MSLDEDPALSSLYRTFITASHILHYHKVLDAYGHLSVRLPSNPTTFLMSHSIAPATISSRSDLIAYHISNAEPVNPQTANKGYAERCIHSEIYKRYPGVHAIVHSHSEQVIPYTINGVPLGATYHLAGFLTAGGGGEGKGKTSPPPVYDNAKWVREGVDTPDMLVRNTHLGAALARHFDAGDPSSSSSSSTEAKTANGGEPDYAVVLMRGHGLTVVAQSIEEAVGRAIYTQSNAGVQTTALLTRLAYKGLGSGTRDEKEEKEQGEGLHFLSLEESVASKEMSRWSAGRPWGLWSREVEAVGLYVNKG